jgi:dimethylglycine dehydrogenase
VRAVQTAVGLTEVSGFNRFEIFGPGALPWLDRLVCGRLPGRVGRVGLAYLLNDRGGIMSEATLARLDDDTIWYGSAAASEYHDRDWLMRHLPDNGSVQVRSLTNDMTLLVLAGPRARSVLSAAARGDWSATGFPWLSVRRTVVGTAPAVVMAISYCGELAYEIHVPNAFLPSVWATLRQAGRPHGLRLFGAHAVESMRLEKGYRHWKADLVTEFLPQDCGLGRFVDLSKPDFIGKAALLTAQPRKAFVTLMLECAHAPALPGDSILAAGRLVGSVTSAGWGHRVGRNLALGFVDPAWATQGTPLEVEVIGEPVPAQVAAPCLYDPDNSRVRA